MKLSPLRLSFIAPLLAVAGLASTARIARAQFTSGDARDRVVLADGSEHRGRVLWQHDPEGLVHLLTPRGRVERLERATVVQLETVNQRVETFLGLRSPEATLDEEWGLVEAARDAELFGLARAQAYHLLTRDPSDARAHGFLGHQRRGGEWRWAVDGGRRFLDADDWAEHHRDTGHPLVLESEHYLIHTTADLDRAVDVLFDLERLYVEFHRAFGAIDGLQPQEVVRRPMKVWINADVDSFPATGSAKLPFYAPGLLLAPSAVPEAGSGNEVRTYFDDGAAIRPRRLFELAAQQLLYTSVLGETQNQWSSEFGFYRESAWLEVGFGNWFGGQLGGLSGYARRQPFVVDPLDLAEASGRSSAHYFRKGRDELATLVGLNYEFFLQNDAVDRRAVEARANTFFAFLVDDATRFPDGRFEGLPTRPALLAYMRKVYLTSRGSSSSALDQALGTRIENLEAPWKAWLRQPVSVP